MRALLPSNESERLRALQASRIVDTQPEPGFDELARLAAVACHAPAATLTFVDERRSWVKAAAGLEAGAGEVERELSFCAHAILQSGVLVVPDTTRDVRFADNPRVTGAPHIRFYAGAPVMAAGDHAVGVLSVTDYAPRELTAMQIEALRGLAEQAAARLKVRCSGYLSCTHDLEGRFLAANQAMTRLSGYPLEVLLRMNVRDLLAPEGRSGFEEYLKTIARRGTARGTMRIRTAAGQTRYWKYSNELRGEGTVPLVFGTGADVTEAAARRSQQRRSALPKRRADEINERGGIGDRHFRDLIDATGPATLVGLLTPEGRVVEANQAALDATGLPADRVVGMMMEEIEIFRHSEEVWKRLRMAIRAAAKGEPVRYELIVPGANSALMTLDFSLQPVRNSAGEVIFIVPSANVITERKQAEEALRECEARTRLLVAASNIGLWDWNVLTNEVYLSPEWKTQLGYQEDEIGNRYEEWVSRLHPDDRGPTTQVLKDYLQGIRPEYDLQFRVRHRDGSWRTMLARTDVIRNEEGVSVRLMGCHFDVTELRRQDEERRAERHRAENALRLGEKRLRDLIDRVGPSMFVGLMSVDGTLIEVNRPALAVAGLEPSDVLGKRLDETYWWSYSAEVQKQLREAMASAAKGHSSRYDVNIRVAHHRFIVIDFSLQPLLDEAGRVTFLVPSASVITERKEAGALTQLANARLQNLSGRLLAVQETERRQLARELHDEVGQALTAIKIDLQTQRQGSPNAARLDESIAIVDQVLRQVRTLSLQLRPPMLDDFGLAAAIRWVVDQQARRAGLRLELRDHIHDARFDAAIETACFRIAQESTTNAVRHAAARHLVVDLGVVDGTLHLRVRDDGVGFDIAAARLRSRMGESLGLTGMEDRAALVGGTIQWMTIPGEGTEVHASFPCTRPRKPGRAS